MRKFEYKILAIPANDKALNELGEDGWELVNVIAGDTAAPTMIFKKEKPREFSDSEPRKSFGDRAGKKAFNSKPRDCDKPRTYDRVWEKGPRLERRPAK